MKISELKAGQGNVEIEAAVIEMSEPREFNKYGRILRVANAVVKDDSGTIKLSLWNTDIDRVKVGNIIKITNGYVSEFQGEKQLTTGKFGKLDVIGGSEKTPEKAEEKIEGKAEEKIEGKAEEKIEGKVEEKNEKDKDKKMEEDENKESFDEEEVEDTEEEW
jgi:replication factor A1